MATLRELRWEIEKQLHLLVSSSNCKALYKVALCCAEEGEKGVPDGDATEVELYDVIVDFMRGEQLQSLEDQGMARLLTLHDLVRELTATEQDSALDVAEIEETVGLVSQPALTSAAARVQVAQTTGLTSHSRAEQTVPLPRVSEQMTGLIKFSDVASYLPRREFKIYGGQISDSNSDLSFNSICKQIDEGIAENFSESEVIRTVLKVIKPGTFKEMLITKDSLTVAELKRFLRAHLRDKSSTELFQELSNAKQQDKESPQQFMYRLMGLKQRVLFASEQTESEFQYDRKLVQGVFLHSLYQGLNEKYTFVRRDIKAAIGTQEISDDQILELITQSVSEETERQKRIGHIYKSKVTIASVTQQEDGKGQCSSLNHAEVRANRDAIHELSVQVSALTKNLEKVVMSMGPGVQQQTQTVAASAQQQVKSEAKGKCQQCISQNVEVCTHCFFCGQAGHRAVGCLMKSRALKERRSLGRDHQ